MDDFIAARSQMAMSLAFHIVFSCVGMVMPFMMAIAHYKYLTTKNEIYKGLTKAWSKGVAILFATGAVSGTMLSFELGLLFPKFMEHAGPIFGMPFSLEGTAFFIEAIALGFFLYGWDKFNKWFHWICGVIVGISGLASGILVVAANAWMNSPTGFDFVNGQYLNIDPVKAMFNDAWFSQALHMTIAAFCATGFAVAGLHAYLILKGKNVNFHREAFKISSVLAISAAMLAPISGDISAKDVANRQPIKLAAMEAHFKTEESAAFVLGGIVNEEKEEIKYAVKVPGVLSFLVHSDFKTPVKGLEEFPKDEWPPVAIVHYAFQIMITFGMLMMGIAIIYLIAHFFKKEWRTKRWFYKLFMVATPFGYIALEAGWTVTEVGRQPWIIYGIMRTVDSITPMPGIQYSFYIFTFVFITLSIILVFLMNRQIQMVAKLYDPEDPNYKPEKH
ncbi:cytochrome ubiquinol oxidase subunit I [Empedobacter brevis]|uniref:Cytochrome ubiquinol oxidase subunit I n=2 Tax=Empedobacter brevis TaxID=247 RepID=A0A511NMV8_9FLAO|nr:cytochrome ubiquinol oxidase subunit I [Empedobacter brevis]MDM1074006.1 cytochrome ubiquinol oxidase subunit I [Empedobacter brevis]QHC84763.1 cytochrome BD ubiquinol oxidase subunit I [Empedobacter brevis]GEM53561.1 cytochrome ubiquinol oxidase subunit I [Empedobacter brevis NBRC 14943 = ATCC 43319]